MYARGQRRPPQKAAATGSIHRIGKRIKRKLDAGERKIDLYQIGTKAAEGKAEKFGGEFAAQGVAAEAECCYERGSTAEERVEN